MTFQVQENQVFIQFAQVLSSEGVEKAFVTIVYDVRQNEPLSSEKRTETQKPGLRGKSPIRVFSGAVGAGDIR